MWSDPRILIERLCTERGEDFAGLSRMLGRNPAYIQQFVRRGVPRRLGESERRKLARYFAIPESLLGGQQEQDEEAAARLVPVTRSAVRASAGPGAFAFDDGGRPYFAFDARWLRTLTASPTNRLSIIRVEGDSMAATLNAGDDILVDHGDTAESLRDGIYVLRSDEALVVKRLALHPIAGTVTVQSDNHAYPDWLDCKFDEIQCIGRVIWAGRKID